MGEVYRVTDTKLKRQVALKILPAALASDRERLARFQREAELLAALNHPNIAAIYGLEEFEHSKALVMELVEGEDLAQRIAHGAIPLEESLKIVKQIAEALEAAHEQGIIHRDLKPANVKVRPDGLVKVLDFGLAKALEPVGSAPVPSQSSTMALPAMTQSGVILGTPAYMSPEQARGKTVDRRTDIWALGCVLFEMLSGKDAFPPGDTISDTIVSILTKEPDWSRLPELPVHVRRVLRRCLQKDPSQRWRDIGDVRLELEEGIIDVTPSSQAIAPAPPRRPAWQMVAGVTVLAVVAAALGVTGGRRLTPVTAEPVTRFSFVLPEGQQLSRPAHQSVAISPDGTRIVYVADRKLYVRTMSALEATPIPGTDLGVENPAFSPDGQSIVFSARSDGTLRRIALTGGAAVTIAPAGAVFGLSWAHDNTILYGQELGAKGILRVPASGGTPELVVVAKGREEAHGPQLLPDGEHVLLTLATGTGATRWDGAQIVAQSLKTGQRKTLVSGGTDGRYLSTGHLVYGLGNVLFAVAFDASRLEVTGNPVPMADGVRSSGSLGSMQFSVSDTGALVYIAGRAAAQTGVELGLVDRKGAVEKLPLPSGAYATPRVSPDGKRVAMAIDDGKDTDIWIYELSGASANRRLTFGGRNSLPIWSPDSTRIAFQSDRQGDEGIYWQPADGSGAAERLTKADPGSFHSPATWSPDGAHLLFDTTTGVNVVLSVLSVQDKQVAPFGAVTSAEPTNASFSRDGHWVAYSSTEGGRRLLVQPFPATGAKFEVSDGIDPVWSSDGKELGWYGDRGFETAVVATRPTFTLGRPVVTLSRVGVGGPTLPRPYDLTLDGRLLGELIRPADPNAARVPPTFQVVLNWFEELKAKVPTK